MTAAELKATLGASIVETALLDPAHAEQARQALARHGIGDVELEGHTVATRTLSLLPPQDRGAA